MVNLCHRLASYISIMNENFKKNTFYDKNFRKHENISNFATSFFGNEMKQIV